MSARTHHVVLVTYGEPETPAFGEQLAYSWRILLGLTRTVAPIPRPLLPVIALARGRARSRSWRDEGYASPLEPITRRQADRLRGALAALDGRRPWRVHVAYEFRHPLLPDVLDAVPGGDPTWVVPMYATDSAFTHGLSRTVVSSRTAAAAGAVAATLPPIDRDALATVSAAHVEACLAREPGWRGPDVALVLAAHGTLVNPPRPVDTGLEATERLCDAIRGRLSPMFGMVVNGWLNHTRGGTWTSPAIDEALRQVAEAGFEKVVYYPYGFLADNAETELEGRIALRQRPTLRALQLPCLNDSPRLAAVLARQLVADAR